MDDKAASHGLTQWHGTTIIGVKRGDKVVITRGEYLAVGDRILS